MKAVVIHLAFACALFATHVTRVSSDMQTESPFTSLNEDSNSTEKCEGTALHIAIRLNISILVTQLLKEGADAYAMSVCVKEDNLKLTQILINSKANITRLSNDGESYIHLAARHNSLSVMKVLLKKGLPADTVSLKDQTPMGIAVENDNLDVVKTLIRHNANIRRVSKLGDSYVHLSVRSNSKSVVKYLLENGLYVDARGENDETPLMIAVKMDNYEMTEVLLEYKANVNQHLYEYKNIAVANKALRSARLMGQHCPYIDERDFKGYNAMYYAVAGDDIDAASVIAELGADLSQVYGGRYHTTLLHLAAGKGYARIASWLIQRGVDVNITDSHEATPLHDAAQSERLTVAQLLVENGACVNCKDDAGRSPLSYAAQFRRSAVAKYLESKGGVI